MDNLRRSAAPNFVGEDHVVAAREVGLDKERDYRPGGTPQPQVAGGLLRAQGERIAEVVAADGAQITYIPRQDATPKSEAEALAACYRFILRCAEEREKGGAANTADDAKEIDDEFRATPTIPR